MLSFCTQVTHLFHIMQSGSRKIFFLCFVQLFRLQSQSRKWRCQSTIRKVGTSYKYRYKYCMIKALLTIRELHTVCPWSEFQSQLSCSHKFIISEEAMSLSVFPHCITIALFCVVVMVSAHLCVVCRHFCHPMSLSQGHVLVRILPEQSSIQTTSSPPFFLRGDFHAPRVLLALLSLRKNGELLVVQAPLLYGLSITSGICLQLHQFNFQF